MWCSKCGGVDHYAVRCPDVVVVNIPEVVVNEDIVVVNRKGDRHKMTEVRRTYMREYMRRVRSGN